MGKKPTYEELEQRIKELETKALESRLAEETTLGESEARYRSIFEHTGAATVIIEEDTTLSMVNTRFENLSGYSKKEIEGRMKWTNFVAAEDLERMKGYHAKRREDEGMAPTSYEFHLVDRQGKIKNILLSVGMIPGTKKSVASLIDMTHLKQTEVLLRESKRIVTISSRIARLFITVRDDQVFGKVLQVVLAAMKSDYGIFGYINENGALVCSSFSKDVWVQCEVSQKEMVFSREKWGGIWGQALKEKKHFYLNNNLSVPEGHVQLQNALAVPIINKKDVIGLLTVANKSTDYDEEDSDLLETIAKSIAPILNVRIQRDMQLKERERAEKQLIEYSENLEHTVQERTKALRRALYDTEESRDKIDGILKSIADGLIVTDIYTRIILMNRAAEDLLGVRFSEVINRPIDVAIKDETLRLRFKKSLEEREPGYQFDFELPGENSKHPRIIRARTSEIKDKAGRQTGIITIIYDVTLEREVDRMKTEFISTAAHQLRTPLTSIQGFSEILMTRDNIKEQEKKEFISYINTQSVNLANIINDLLDISRIESGIGFTLYKVPCDINEIIRERVKYFQSFYPKRQFDIILPKEPVEVKVDKDKIGQVLENILSNAVKYSPEGGDVCLTAKKIEDFGFRIAEYPIADGRLQNACPVECEAYSSGADLKGEEKQAAIEISVADQGIGMRSDQVEQIFDKFYRVDASNKAISGTGLGMSIVRNYVEAHGGKVWVESELGKGTVVKFVLQI